MGNWFSKATNVFQPIAQAAPQTYSLNCSCGEVYQGLRQAGHQQIHCRICGRSLFVHPADVYPPPQTLKPKAATKTSTSETAPVSVLDDTELNLADSLQEVSSPKTQNGKSKRTRKESDSSTDLPSIAQIRQRMRDAEKPRAPKAVATAVPEKISPVEGLGTALGTMGREAKQEFVRFWTPFRILAAVVLIVGAFTIVWTVRQSDLAKAIQIAKVEGELGMAAVAQEDWTTAREHLQLASAALKKLGRIDPEAMTIRQYAAETEAQFRLCDVSLPELLTQAQTELNQRDVRGRAAKGFATAYRGSWLLFEGVVKEVSSPGAWRKSYAMTLPVGPGETLGSTTVRMNFPVLKSLIAPGAEKQLILAGELEECEVDANGNWIVTLKPASGFLWAHLNTYRVIGFDFNPLRTEKIVEAELLEQARAVGVPP